MRGGRGAQTARGARAAWQLAFVLGHEFSHYLLDHGSEQATLQGALSVLQLVVLSSVDPTGFLSLFFEVGLGRRLLDLAAFRQSRTHETDADELGLQLAARSCHEPRLAAKAHATLEALEKKSGADTSKASIFATHPPTEARLQALEAQVPAATQLYDACGCSTRSRVLLRSLGVRQ